MAYTATNFVEKMKAMTCKGTFKWPHLIVPDTRFSGDAIPDYTSNIVFDPDAADVQEFLNKVRKFDEAGYAAASKTVGKSSLPRRQCIKDDLDADGEPTGLVAIKVKSKSAFKDRRTGAVNERSLKLFNAKGTDVTGASNYAQIWSGTTGKMQLTLDYNKAPNGYGVTMYIDAVQVIDLVAGSGGRDAGDFGFSAEVGTSSEPEFAATPAAVVEDEGVMEF